MIIDAHAHVLERAFADIHSPRYQYSIHKMTGDLLVDEMNHAGVDKAFLMAYDAETIRFSIEIQGGKVENTLLTKEYHLKYWNKYRERFEWFTAVNTRKKGYLNQMVQDLKSDGAKGIDLYPYYPLLPDDPKSLEIYDQARRFKVPVTINANCYIESSLLSKVKPNLEEYLKKIGKVAELYEDLKFSLSHTGSLTVEKIRIDDTKKGLDKFEGLNSVVEVINNHDNISTEIAGIHFTLRASEEDYPWSTSLELLEILVDAVSAEKIMYSSDFPFCEHNCKYRQTVTFIKNAANFLSQREKKLILGINATRYIGL